MPALTTLRFFAAAEVVCFHRLYTPIPEPTVVGEIVRGIVSGGYEAVAFFFILSGFILIYVYADEKHAGRINVAPKVFWRARIARIAPAYYLSLALLAPSFIYSALVAKTISIKFLILGAVLVPTFLQAWWPPAALLWNPPAWSLSIEALFYALFPLLLRNIFRWPRSVCLLGCFILIVAASLLQTVLIAPTNVYFSTDHCWDCSIYFPLVHLPQFLFGMALGLIFLFGRPLKPKLHAIMFCFGSLGLVLLFAFRFLGLDWLQSEPVLALLYAIIIFGGAHPVHGFNVLASPILVGLGEISYSMYILHVPISFWWNWLVQKQLGLLFGGRLILRYIFR
jgi:peptidoglycan/LPS O-acetylase OafA/YrhL